MYEKQVFHLPTVHDIPLNKKTEFADTRCETLIRASRSVRCYIFSEQRRLWKTRDKTWQVFLNKKIKRIFKQIFWCRSLLQHDISLPECINYSSKQEQEQVLLEKRKSVKGEWRMLFLRFVMWQLLLLIIWCSE